jgi:excisionase family DNA binding protein
VHHGPTAAPTGEQFLSRRSAALRLGVGLTTIDLLISEGRLFSVRLNRRRLIPESALSAFMAGLAEESR